MFGKRKFKEIYERRAELEFENYRLEKRIGELEKHLPETRENDAPSCKQIIDEWLNGKS